MKAIEDFLQKEKEHKMFNWKYEDFYYWENIRVFVSHEINRIIGKSSPWFGNPIKGLKKFKISFKNLKSYFLHHNQKNSDILIVSHPRREFENNKYKNVYTDNIVDYLSKYYKVLTLEDPAWCWYAPTTVAHKFPLYTKNIYLTDIIDLKHLFVRKFHEIFCKKEYQKLLIEYEKIKNEIISWYPKEDMTSIDFKSKFLDAMYKHILEYRDIERIINKINPKIVLLHYYPTHLKMILIEICKKKNIPTVEIQHGIITKNDPIINKCYVPNSMRIATDYIFSFGKLTLDQTDSTVPKENIKYTGFPYFEKKLNKKEKIPDVINTNKKHILIISQSAIGTQISNFASKLADEIKNDNNYDIIFKYHPHELMNDYANLKKENIIEIRNECDIYQIQKYTDLEIGVFSTSVFEGIAFKIPTLVIENIFGAEEVVDLLKNLNKGVYFIKKPKDVLKFLENSNKFKPSEKDASLLWNTNSLKNIKKEIDNILQIND